MEIPFTIKYDKSICHDVMLNIENIDIYSLCFSITYATFNMYLNKKYLFVSKQQPISYKSDIISIYYNNDTSLLKPMINLQNESNYNKIGVIDTSFNMYEFYYLYINESCITSFSPDDSKYIYIDDQSNISLASSSDKQMYTNNEHVGFKKNVDNGIDFFKEPVTYKNYKSAFLGSDTIIYLSAEYKKTDKHIDFLVDEKFDGKNSLILNESLSVDTFIHEVYNSKSPYKLLYRDKPDVIKNKVKTVSTNKKGIITNKDFSTSTHDRDLNKEDYIKSLFKNKSEITRNSIINIGNPNKDVGVSNEQNLIDVKNSDIFKIENTTIDVSNSNIFKVDNVIIDNNNNDTIINNYYKMIETNPSSLSNSLDSIELDIDSKDLSSKTDLYLLDIFNKDINYSDSSIGYKQSSRDMNYNLSNVYIQKNHADITNVNLLISANVIEKPVDELEILNIYKKSIDTNSYSTLVELYRNVPGLYVDEEVLFFDIAEQYKSKNKGVIINNDLFVRNNDRRVFEQRTTFINNNDRKIYENYLLYTYKDSDEATENQHVLLKDLDKQGLFSDKYKTMDKSDIGTLLSEDVIFDLEGNVIDVNESTIVNKKDIGIYIDTKESNVKKSDFHTHLDYILPWIDKDLMHAHLDYDYPWVYKYRHNGNLHNTLINFGDNIKHAHLDYVYLYINKNTKNASLHEYYNSSVSKNTEHFMYSEGLNLGKYSKPISDDFSLLNLSKMPEGIYSSYNVLVQKDSKGALTLDNLLINNNSKAIEIYKNTFIDKYNNPIYMNENIVINRYSSGINMNEDVFINKYPIGVYENQTLFINKFSDGIEIQRDTIVDKFDSGIDLNDDISVYEFGRDTRLRNSYLPIDMYTKNGAFNRSIIITQDRIDTDIEKTLTMDSADDHLFYNPIFDIDKSIGHAQFNNTEEFVNMTRNIGDMRFDSGTRLDKYIKDTNMFVQGDFVTVIHYDGADKPIGLSGKIDELLLPHKDYTYRTLFDKLVYPDGSINYKYVKSYDPETGDYVVSLPIENPIDIYADVGRDYIDIDSNILNTVIYMIREIWKENMFRYVGFSAQDSIKDILVKLDLKIQTLYDGNKVMIFQCMRCMQLFRWYAEMAILNNCEYVLNFDTTKAVVDYFNKTLGMFKDIIIFDNMYISDEYIIEPEDVKKSAMITFVRNRKTPGKPFNLSFTLYNINVSSSISIIDDDGTKSLRAYEPGVHQIQLELKNQITVRFIPTGKNQTVNVANISIDNLTLRGFTVSYKGRFGETNAVLQDLLDRLFVVGEASAELKSQLQNVVPTTVAIDTIIKYFELHHENKSKGKRLITKR